ncbi:MAG: large-conductance mechanosensitive channel protein MscL [Phycisphaeraceae bacterium]|nr:large-conductance mechanosensitive channel protein MscL [Phycisphaeraceae bacterium]MCW5753525.1 large-conductance mechanosensitive channel protein MscL [Phycisphaeraceae bacterium]
MGILQEFKAFAMRGNVVDMAVGIIIGAAFGKIVSALVEKVLMPPLGLLLGGVDFAEKKLVLQKAGEHDGKTLAEVSIFYGEFINVIINFIIVAFAIFMMIKFMNRLKKKDEAAPPPPPPGPSAEEILLTEIRDLLRQRA